eukprot:365563-Chlamydomonas_euryale.AAC.6
MLFNFHNRACVSPSDGTAGRVPQQLRDDADTGGGEASRGGAARSRSPRSRGPGHALRAP